MRFQPHLTFVLGLAALASGSACSSVDAGPYADVGGFCAEKAKAECQVAAPCATDANACASYRATLCNEDATAALANGVRKYVSGNAQACIDALNKVYGGASTTFRVSFSDLVGRGSTTDICARVFVGAVAFNQACHSDYDCAGDRICAVASPGITARVCADPTQVAAGAPCANAGSECATDSYCALVPMAAPVCAPALVDGQACSAAQPCVSTARCLGGTCAPRALGGAPCGTSDDCDPTVPYCTPFGNICAIGYEFVRGSTDCPYFTAGSAGVSAPVVAPFDGGADVGAE